MRICISVILLSFLLGCGKVEENVKKPKTEVIVTKEKQEEKERGPNMTYGPKIDFKPSYNISTGEFSFGPDMNFGPHLEF